MSGPVFENFYFYIRQIPRGKVATYGQIAALAGMPRSAKVVGYAVSACTPEDDIPCHRVVDRFGGTKKAFDVHAPGTQRMLLEAEGISFLENSRVDLEKHLWDPESDLA